MIVQIVLFNESELLAMICTQMNESFKEFTVPIVGNDYTLNFKTDKYFDITFRTPSSGPYRISVYKKYLDEEIQYSIKTSDDSRSVTNLRIFTNKEGYITIIETCCNDAIGLPNSFMDDLAKRISMSKKYEKRYSEHKVTKHDHCYCRGLKTRFDPEYYVRGRLYLINTDAYHDASREVAKLIDVTPDELKFEYCYNSARFSITVDELLDSDNKLTVIKLLPDELHGPGFIHDTSYSFDKDYFNLKGVYKIISDDHDVDGYYVVKDHKFENECMTEITFLKVNTAEEITINLLEYALKGYHITAFKKEDD